MKIKNFFKILLGCVALFFGFLGLLLPVLPTTPFVLLAVFCFSANPNLQKRMLNIPFVKRYYESYTKKTGLSVATVSVSLTFLWGMLLLSAMLVQTLWLVFLFAIVGIAVTIHILWIARLRTQKKHRNVQMKDHISSPEK